jgi:hypothetical protein
VVYGSWQETTTTRDNSSYQMWRFFAGAEFARPTERGGRSEGTLGDSIVAVPHLSGTRRAPSDSSTDERRSRETSTDLPVNGTFCRGRVPRAAARSTMLEFVETTVR